MTTSMTSEETRTTLLSKPMIKLLVCGGRDFGKLPMATSVDGTTYGPDRAHPDFIKRLAEYEFIKETLYKFAEANSAFYNPNDNWLPADIHIISGGATGADSVAIDWAVVNWCTFDEYKADWDRYDYKAGPIRNAQMLREGKPTIVMAFPGGNGTADMVAQARMAGVKIIHVKYDEKQSATL